MQNSANFSEVSAKLCENSAIEPEIVGFQQKVLKSLLKNSEKIDKRVLVGGNSMLHLEGQLIGPRRELFLVVP